MDVISYREKKGCGEKQALVTFFKIKMSGINSKAHYIKTKKMTDSRLC